MASSGPRSQRADWQRNHERLLAAARPLVARDGAQVSLEQVAREAGVGSATLHRHFPSRRALLDEVFREAVEHLRRRGDELVDGDPGAGLLTWLEELTVAAVETRGLTASLEADADGGPSSAADCHGVVREATVHLMDRALAAGAVRPGTSPDDLLALVTAISLANEGNPAAARRLLRLACDGVRP
ncbi:AcrR family transcriptional regulator [Saccharothrix tamanrassetensis]|uniref:AcrR family transcriptional regulator n=1 Tax=Saccharothrix tamanrassetensis TaxID=1051531 RepID=A0A841CUX5_9PSEU|nr:TetR/AcrR family transcriptional regulator [Saccharothrix tamanrassetensis]MBB5960623.1 AcrR family transcriptional regulator [Saccharothrix tamanrassetensis]